MATLYLTVKKQNIRSWHSIPDVTCCVELASLDFSKGRVSGTGNRHLIPVLLASKPTPKPLP